MANPTLLTSPIAENGDKNVIPASTGATTGLLDQEHGFQQINELPLQAGGLPPQRKDFNGAFNLLSKILFYTQKGYIFEFDENQDYYAGCVAKDIDDGLYCAKTDVPASSTHPKDDPTNWSLINFGLSKKETLTSSGSFTAPITGTYRITLQGGGGGGYVYELSTQPGYAGTGGGAGASLVFYEKLVKGTSYPYVIGAGGAAAGGAGGTSSITINSNTYECYGGNSISGGMGGYAKINGTNVARGFSGCKGQAIIAGKSYIAGGVGGGEGGAHAPIFDGINGGGGCGGTYQNTLQAPSAGGDGYISFEYCDI